MRRSSRDLGGAVPHPGLSLRLLCAGGGASRATTPGFIYSRFSNPTVGDVRAAHGALEAQRRRAATASAWAVTAALMGSAQGGDHVVASRALFGSCLYVRRGAACRGSASPRRWSNGSDLAAWTAAIRPQHQDRLSRKPDQSDAGRGRYPAASPTSSTRRSDAGGRQRLRFADVATPARARRRLRRLSATKAHRRPGPPLGGIILAAENSSPTTSTTASARPAPACRRSTPGVLLKSLETLPLRVGQWTARRRKIADFLAAHPKVARVSIRAAPTSAARGGGKQMSGGGTLWRSSRRGQGGGRSPSRRVDDHRHLQQPRRRQEPRHHPETTTHQRLKARSSAPPSASAPACCGFRSDSRIPTTDRDLDQALGKLAAVRSAAE